MARKTKKKRSETTTARAPRAPIVSIKQRDEQLANDLKNMKQKDALKYGTHLFKMIAENSEYQDLIFNLPHLAQLLKRYELEKKPSGIKNKIFKQSMAKDGSEYILPKLVDAQYTARAKSLIERKFNSDPAHEDKMALAIAKASLEMYGKVVQGVKISVAEVPLFQISLSASFDLIKKITKAEKDDKTVNLSEASKALEIFPRWHDDLNLYQERITKDIRSQVNASKNSVFLPASTTVELQNQIWQQIQSGKITQDQIQEFALKKKISGDILKQITELAKKSLASEIIAPKNSIALNLERTLKDSFQEFAYQFFSYLLFIEKPDPELLLPVYVNQALLHLAEDKGQNLEPEIWKQMAAKASHKDEKLLCYQAALTLGDSSGELIYEIGSLFKSMHLLDEGKKLYETFLDKPEAKKDKFYKKISKELSKNFS